MKTLLTPLHNIINKTLLIELALLGVIMLEPVEDEQGKKQYSRKNVIRRNTNLNKINCRHGTLLARLGKRQIKVINELYVIKLNSSQ